MSPWCDLDLEDSNYFFLHHTLACDAVLSNQVWLQVVQEILYGQNPHRQSDSNITPKNQNCIRFKRMQQALIPFPYTRNIRYLPRLHWLEAVLATPVVVKPSSQAVQFWLPVMFLNVPTGQARQGRVPFGEKKPGAQSAGETRNNISNRGKMYKWSDGDVPLGHCCHDQWNPEDNLPSNIMERWSKKWVGPWCGVYVHINMNGKV